MSHVATNWAIQQRGLKPAAKLVLLQLADCHNKHTGDCYPSQARLAYDCEMSRATVNRHLDKLEADGLIKRLKRFNPQTRKQESTLYILAINGPISDATAIEGDGKTVSQTETRPVSQKSPNPCLKNGESRVSKCDTNLGKEPGKEPCNAVTPEQIERFATAHPRVTNLRATKLAMHNAVTAGADAEMIIRAAEAYRSAKHGTPEDFIQKAHNWLHDRKWLPGAKNTGHDPDGRVKVAEMWANTFREGGYIPPTAITGPIADTIQRAGLLSPDELKCLLSGRPISHASA